MGHLSSNGAPRSSSSLTSTTTAIDRGSELGAGASKTLLSVEKGPCEFCHQVIPLAQLIGHEVNAQRENLSIIPHAW